MGLFSSIHWKVGEGKKFDDSFQVSQIKYSITKIMYDDQDYQHINHKKRIAL